MNNVYVSLVTFLGTIVAAGLTFVSARRANHAQEAAVAVERQDTNRAATLREMEVAIQFTGQQNELLRQRVTEQDQQIRNLEEEAERCRQEIHRLRRQIYAMGGAPSDDN